MKNLTKLMQYLTKLKCERHEGVKDIPISRVEIVEIQRESGPMYNVQLPPSAGGFQVFGTEVWITEKAEQVRKRRLEFPIYYCMQEYSLDEALYHNLRQTVTNNLLGLSIQRIEAQILADKTSLNVTYEWDIWAKLKRFFHLDKKFPIKTKTVRIDCLILYPYCKVQLPHNKHTFQASFKP